MEYSKEFEAAWLAYKIGATPIEKNRSGKLESFRLWESKGLEDIADSVMAWIKTAQDTYSPGYRPSFQRYLRIVDFNTPTELDKATSETTGGPSLHDRDWAGLIHQTKLQALTGKLMHPRTPYLYPESIVLVVRDMARGTVGEPYTIAHVLEIAKARAAALKAKLDRDKIT